jgi:hypothetical protein
VYDKHGGPLSARYGPNPAGDGVPGRWPAVGLAEQEMIPKLRPGAEYAARAVMARAAFALVRAEAAGFEPARGDEPSTRLAGGRHRPD